MFPINDDAPSVKGRPFVNYGLIAINVIVFIYELIITSNFSNKFAEYNLYANYGSIPSLILSGQNLPSIFTSMFMHGSIAHIIGNMLFLYVFGDNLEGRYGHFKYLLLYLLWGVVATFVHGIYAVSTGEGDIPAIGASGAISGVMGAYLIFFPHSKIYTIIFAFFITTIRIPAIAYIPFWFIMQLVFALIGQSGGVAYLAHVGGFVGGVATAFLWKYFGNMFNRSSLSKHTTGVNNPYTLKNKNLDSAIINKDTSPEIIVGNDYVDVIIESFNIHLNSDVQVNFNPATNILKAHVAKLSKNYSIPIPNPNNFAFVVSSVSVLNGIIKIRLQREIS